MTIRTEVRNVRVDEIQSPAGVTLLQVSGNDIILNAPGSGGDILLQSNGFDKLRYDPGINRFQVLDNVNPARRLNLGVSSFSSAALDSGTGVETLVGVVPGNAFIFGITWRITTALTGAGLTTFGMGDGTDPDRYGATQPIALDSLGDMSDATADPSGFQLAAGDVVLTADAGQFDGGNITVVVYFLDLTHTT